MIDSCTRRLEQENYRQTETRRVLLSVLHDATGPLATPDIVSQCHKAGRKANKTTIYRDLAAMERAGIVRRVIVSDRKQYFELTERGHHHHLVCTRCEEIQDVDLDEVSVLDRAERLSKKLGFVITSHAVEFYGLCRSCVRSH